MKTTLITIAMALATMPLTFAGQAPATPATNGQSTPPASTTVKKHTKKHSTKPAVKNSNGSSTTAAPAASPVKK